MVELPDLLLCMVVAVSGRGADCGRIISLPLMLGAGFCNGVTGVASAISLALGPNGRDAEGRSALSMNVLKDGSLTLSVSTISIPDSKTKLSRPSRHQRTRR